MMTSIKWVGRYKIHGVFFSLDKANTFYIVLPVDNFLRILAFLKSAYEFIL